VHFRGFWPGQRAKQVDARKRRQEQRLIKKGITGAKAWKLKRFVEKHSSYNPYLQDPQKLKSPTAQTEAFNDQLNVRVKGKGR
jgi:hypothetical protein